ncbi:MAG TPA: DUF4962 domain-containing protein [Bryobacteraceae bacterium]|nr:DUF4962 domain-containing protein [Bryobacteraceae bacterium]
MLRRAIWLLAAIVSAPCIASIPVIERPARPEELIAYPQDGQQMAVNPPGFRWMPCDGARSYRLEVRTESGRPVLSTDPQPSTAYPPYRKLAPGRYVWQVIYLDQHSNAIGASKQRRFEIPSSAPVLLMPDVAALERRLQHVRPRLFLSGDRVSRIRAAVARGAVPSWPQLREAADAALEEKSYPEPAPYRNGRETDDEWLRIFTPGKVGSAHLARTALAYRITREPKYLDGARRWMLTLASWDPKGITSHGLPLPDGTIGNDEASMPMLERMSMAWDWIGDKLTPDERARVLAVMKERGNQVLAKLIKDDFLSHPFNNHSGRVLAFLGEAGLAFLGDIPDAEKWLDYVLRCYLSSYPSWGGDEGGWSQGLSYWAFYVYSLTNFGEALRQATGIDLFQQPFYRNTGYFAAYFQPPYAPAAAFGDGAYHPPNELAGLLVDFLGNTFRDPVLKWQAQQILKFGEKDQTRWREWFMEDVISTWRAAEDPEPRQTPPLNLDGSRYFPDIGWVAMHSALGDAANDVWAMFKSSRFGSYSHSHADQNSFLLNAYGQALAIDSGYYPSYGTPHDNLWTRQTVAHNDILVNGRGQAPHTWAAAGKIEMYQRHGIITLVRGEAGEAYNLPQPASIGALWEKLLHKPVPPMEPRVTRFERTLAFVASKTSPALIVDDFIQTDGSATFAWLFHALQSMEFDSRSGSILVRQGNARLAVRLLASVPFEFRRQSGFPIPPEVANNTAYVLGKPSFPDEWHLSASTKQPSRDMRYLAILIPYRAGEPEPKVDVLRSADTIGFQTGSLGVAAWWGPGASGNISAGKLNGHGRLVLAVRDGAGNTLVTAE